MAQSHCCRLCQTSRKYVHVGSGAAFCSARALLHNATIALGFHFAICHGKSATPYF